MYSFLIDLIIYYPFTIHLEQYNTIFLRFFIFPENCMYSNFNFFFEAIAILIGTYKLQALSIRGANK